MKLYKVYGCPGGGKTTFLERIFRDRAKTHAVAFFTFTVSAKEVMRGRLSKEMPDVQMRNIRTLHSFAYHYCGKPELSNHSWSFWQEMKDRGYTITRSSNDEPLIESQDLLRHHEYYKHTGRYIAQAEDLSRIQAFGKVYEETKARTHLLDYTDLLYEAIEKDAALDDVEIIFADEFQDFTPLEVKLWNLLCRGKREIWIAGDPLQTIYTYAGAEPELFTEINADKTYILDKSYRCPQSVLNYAYKFIVRNKENYLKEPPKAAAEKPSLLQRYFDFESIIKDIKESTTTWFLIFRNRYNVAYAAQFLKSRFVPFQSNRVEAPDYEPYQAYCTIADIALEKTIPSTRVQQAVDFMWSSSRAPHEYGLPHGTKKALSRMSEDATFNINNYDVNVKAAFRMCAVEPLKFMKFPDDNQKDSLIFWQNVKMNYEVYNRLFISTIHGVKGDEADNVVLCDAISYAVAQQLQMQAASENRVLYVGSTRARSQLSILHHPSASTRYAL